MITEVSYDGLNVKQVFDIKIEFSTIEIIQTKDDTTIKHGIEVTLLKEADGQWRVIEEHLMDDVNARNLGLPI